jgi:hypothetical protein
VSERASFGNMVRYEDPVTGEYLFRKRTPEDHVLAGDRRVFEGVADKRYCQLDCGFETTPTGRHEHRWTDASCWLAGLAGRHVRIVVEVLDEPKGDDWTECAAPHAPKETP